MCRLLGIKDYSHHSIFAPDVNGDFHEGMHVVEHILLRPLVDNDALLGINSITFFDSEKDPYSFRLTIVLPDFVGRFVELPYRVFVERLIRTETPAHIALDIYWMTEACGLDFENKYRAWMESHAVQPWPTLDPTSSYFSIKADLIEAISLPCGQDIELAIIACNEDGIAFIPDATNRITYTYLCTDIFTLKFLPPCGRAEIYNITTGTEVHKQTIDPAPYQVPYAAGFATTFDGPGSYVVRYYLGSSELELYIDVLPAPTSIDIDVYNNGVLLVLPRGQKCYSIDACEVDQFVIDFVSDGGVANFYKEIVGTNELVLTQDPATHTTLTSLLQEHGAGRYTIEYINCGLTDSICVDLVGIQIRVFAADGTEHFANADGIVALAGPGETIEVQFEEPGGDWVREVDNGIQYVFDGQGNSPSDTLELQGDVFYKYTYERCGLTTSIVICYNIEIEHVSITLYEGETLFPPNNGTAAYILDPFYDLNFHIEFDPVPGVGEIRFTRNGSNYVVDTTPFSTPLHPINWMVLWKDYGPGVYEIHYTVNPTTFITVTLVEPMIRVFDPVNVEQLRTSTPNGPELYYAASDTNDYFVSVGPETSDIHLETDPKTDTFYFKPSDLGPGRFRISALFPLYAISDELYLVISDHPNGPSAEFTCELIETNAEGCKYTLKLKDKKERSMNGVWMVLSAAMGKSLLISSQRKATTKAIKYPSQLH